MPFAKIAENPDTRTDGQTDIPICGDRDVISASRNNNRLHNYSHNYANVGKKSRNLGQTHGRTDKRTFKFAALV